MKREWKITPLAKRVLHPDRILANIAYAHNNIPIADWPSHYAVDSTRYGLTVKARRAYLSVWRSITAGV